MSGVGEEFISVKSPLVHAAIVTEGVPLSSNDQLSVALIGKVLGNQPGLEYSSTQSATKLIKATASVVPDQNFAVWTRIVFYFAYLSPKSITHISL